MWLPLFLSTARAESVIEFKTSTPVAIVVDGQQAALGSDLKQRVGGLDPGVHALQINGVFGKTLYEAEIDLPDNTLTTAEWARGELRIVKTEWLEDEVEDDVDAAPPAEAPEVIDVVPPAAPVAEEPPAPIAPIAVPAEPAVAPPPPVAAAPVPAPPTKQATAMPAAIQPRTLTVQATDGMKIEVVYQGRTLRVIVDGDSFRIEDPTGAVLALGTE